MCGAAHYATICTEKWRPVVVADGNIIEDNETAAAQAALNTTNANLRANLRKLKRRDAALAATQAYPERTQSASEVDPPTARPATLACDDTPTSPPDIPATLAYPEATPECWDSSAPPSAQKQGWPRLAR